MNDMVANGAGVMMGDLLTIAFKKASY